MYDTDDCSLAAEKAELYPWCLAIFMIAAWSYIVTSDYCSVHTNLLFLIKNW